MENIIIATLYQRGLVNIYDFVPIHNHSDYSLLDGASQLPLMVQRAKELGMPALTLTDHGVMYGAIDY